MIFFYYLVVNNRSYFVSSWFTDFSTGANINTVGRVVYGESRGEELIGQKAVAYTIVNRITHGGYPNTLKDVVYQKASNKKYQYETLDLSNHSCEWYKAVKAKNQEYLNAIESATSALCDGKDDPTYCATDFCAIDPCPATSSNQYWNVFNKTRIGGHWFACRRPASG